MCRFPRIERCASPMAHEFANERKFSLESDAAAPVAPSPLCCETREPLDWPRALASGLRTRRNSHSSSQFDVCAHSSQSTNQERVTLESAANEIKFDPTADVPWSVANSSLLEEGPCPNPEPSLWPCLSVETALAATRQTTQTDPFLRGRESVSWVVEDEEEPDLVAAAADESLSIPWSHYDEDDVTTNDAITGAGEQSASQHNDSAGNEARQTR